MSDLVVVVPAPELAVTAVEPVAEAAVPTLRFSGEVADASGREIYTIALTAQVQIDADRRGYDPATRGRLLDLFGEAERIPRTAGPLQLARVETLLPSLRGAGTFALDVPFGADLELATTRYLASLSGGTVPLTFLFSGWIFYCGDGDRLQVTLVPWSATARYRLRVETWRELVERRVGAGGFVRLDAATLAELRRRRVERGLPTLAATIAELLR